MQIIGYIARAVSGKQSPDWILGPYIIQAIFLLVAPALYATTIYMEFRRIVTFVDGKQHTMIRHHWISRIFVAGDVLSFLLQGGGMLTRLRSVIASRVANLMLGGGYQSSGTASALDTGPNIIVIGLFVQLVFFGSFMFTAGAWLMKMLRFSSSRAHACSWKRLMAVLFGISVLIMVRSVFRVVEYLQGNNGYILAHEALFLHLRCTPDACHHGGLQLGPSLRGYKVPCKIQRHQGYTRPSPRLILPGPMIPRAAQDVLFSPKWVVGF